MVWQSAVLQAWVMIGCPALAMQAEFWAAMPLLKQCASRVCVPPAHDAEQTPNTPYCHCALLAHAAVLHAC